MVMVRVRGWVIHYACEVKGCACMCVCACVRVTGASFLWQTIILLVFCKGRD